MQLQLVSEGSPRGEGFTVGLKGLAGPGLHFSDQHCRSPLKGERAAQHMDDVVGPFGRHRLSGHFEGHLLFAVVDDVGLGRV